MADKVNDNNLPVTLLGFPVILRDDMPIDAVRMISFGPPLIDKSLGPIVGWEFKDGIMRPVQPPSPPEPKMYSYTCGDCGKETISERSSSFDLPCEHCGGHRLSILGEEVKQWHD